MNHPAPLPKYNPSVLVLDVQALLGRKGIEVVIDQHNATAATEAAADLLRALRVVPVNAPAGDSGWNSGSMS